MYNNVPETESGFETWVLLNELPKILKVSQETDFRRTEERIS